MHGYYLNIELDYLICVIGLSMCYSCDVYNFNDFCIIDVFTDFR